MRVLVGNNHGSILSAHPHPGAISRTQHPPVDTMLGARQHPGHEKSMSSWKSDTYNSHLQFLGTRPRSLPNPLDQLVPQRSNTGRKGIKLLGVPIGAFCPRYSVLARKGKIQHVVLVVAGIAVDAVAKAGGCEGNGSLANHGLRAVISVFVAPNSVDL